MSTTDSDEENECLKEAIDTTFFSNDLYQSKKQAVVKEKPVKLPPSLRHQDQASSTFNPLEIRVTPEFRAHVSKHLRRILDGLIDYTEELPISKKKTRVKCQKGGVRLLRKSSDYIQEQVEESVVQTKRRLKKKQRKIEDDSSSEEEKRAREVAVTAEWILSGEATKGWAPSTKGELEVITVKSSKR